MRKKNIIFLILIPVFIACNKTSDNKNTHHSIKWSHRADSLLSSTLKKDRYIDSMRLSVANAVNDTIAIMNLNRLSERWKGESGLILATEAFNKSVEHKFEAGEAYALYDIGLYNYRKSNDQKADSFFNLALKKGEKSGSLKVQAKALLQLGNLEILHDKYESAIKYLESSYKLAEKVDEKEVMATSLGYIGDAYGAQSNYDKALQYFLRATKLSEQVDNVSLASFCLGATGGIYIMRGNYPEALVYYNRSAEVARKAGDKARLGAAYGFVAEIYLTQKNYTKAIEYYEAAVKLSREVDNKNGLSSHLSALGNAYYTVKNYKKALELLNESMGVAKEISNKSRIIYTLLVLGEVHSSQKEYDKAIGDYSEAIAISEGLGDKGRLGECYKGIGSVFLKKNKTAEAKNYLEKALKLAQETVEALNICKASEELFKMYEKMAQPAKALEMHKLFIQTRDSISNEEEIRKFASVEYQAKEDRLRAEQEVKDKTFKAERAQKEEELKRQKLLRNMFIWGFILIGVLAFVIFRSLQQNKKAKSIIELQKTEVEHQKELVEEKQKEVMDSIHYAKRIQRSLLPTEKFIERVLKDLE